MYKTKKIYFKYLVVEALDDGAGGCRAQDLEGFVEAFDEEWKDIFAADGTEGFEEREFNVPVHSGVCIHEDMAGRRVAG